MVLLCIAALLIILWLVLGHGKKNVSAPPQSAPPRTHIDTSMARGALVLSEKPVPSRAAKKPRPHGPIKTKADTALSGGISSMAPESTTVDTEETVVDACKSDTLPPWVYTDPSGGLHHTALSVKLFATKPCAIQWKTDSAAAWKDYAGEEILIGQATRLMLFARDSCGNEMAPREEVYEITPEETQRFCPENMEHIKIGGTSFCMDKYEWPNKKGAFPRSYVSVYQAMDTCAAAGKRLCTADESDHRLYRALRMEIPLRRVLRTLRMRHQRHHGQKIRVQIRMPGVFRRLRHVGEFGGIDAARGRTKTGSFMTSWAAFGKAASRADVTTCATVIFPKTATIPLDSGAAKTRRRGKSREQVAS